MRDFNEFIKLAEDSAATKRARYLKDIACERCGYEGPPTNEGCCPNCGAIGGHNPRGPIKPSDPSIQDLEAAQGDVDYEYRKDQSDVWARLYGG